MLGHVEKGDYSGRKQDQTDKKQCDCFLEQNQSWGSTKPGEDASISSRSAM
jgi:hypothetical protein